MATLAVSLTPECSSWSHSVVTSRRCEGRLAAEAALVALRLISTQHTPGHAEAEEEEGEIRAERTPSLEKRRRAVAGVGNDGNSGTCCNRGVWRERGRS
eukprot:6190029-Pleurochrysis_carterae.AAC.5